MNPTQQTHRSALLAGLASGLASLVLASSAQALDANYLYYRWTPTKLRNGATANSIQVSEFQFYRAGNPVSWSGATVTNPGGNNPGTETPAKIIDGLTGTKWLDFNKKALVFSLPSAPIIDSYRFATANDSTERDPVSWTLEGSDNQVSWTLIDVVKDYPTTLTRQIYTPILALPASLVPEILNFQCNNVVVRNGSPSELEWSIDRADSATIDYSVGLVSPVTGSTPINPPDDADTIYTLTASSLGGSATATTIVRSVIGGSTTARYVRFTPLKVRSGTAIQLAKFGFFNGAAPVVPIAATNPGGANAPEAPQGAMMTIDEDPNTKWLNPTLTPLVFEFNDGASFDQYVITTANDAPERDPLRWIMESSDDGDTWSLIENLSTFDFNTPTARLTDSLSIPLPGNSVDPIISASSDFSSMLIGESVNLTWTSTGAATITGNSGIGSLASSGTLTISPTTSGPIILTATAAGGRTKTATVNIQVANPTINKIAYTNFDLAGSEISLRGAAEIVNAFATLPQGGNVKRLRLTPDLNSTSGAAWFRYKQPITQGFEASFGFQFTTSQPNNGADGMAFVIHNDARKAEAMPTTPQELGFPTNALNISLDSYLNTGEASAARLLVLNGAATLATVNLATVGGLSLFTTDQGADLTDTARTGTPFQIRVRYVPGDLDVFINNIQIVTNLNVNLATTGALDGEGKAYVGFTSRTGGSFEAHDVTNWTFTPAQVNFASWISGYAGLSNTTQSGDPDGDGISNVMEYVLNGNPAISNRGILPSITVDAAKNVSFSFVRRTASTADTTQTLLTSPDLLTWTPTALPSTSSGTVTVVPETPSVGLQTVTIAVPATPGGNGKLFARLRVVGQ